MPRLLRLIVAATLLVGVQFGWCGAAAAQVAGSTSKSTAGKSAPPRAKSAELDLEIPSEGIIRQGQGQRVLVKTKAGGQVVAQIHVDIGDRRLVIQPNGVIESLAIKDTKLTQQPFVPATKDEISAELTAEKFQGFKTRSTARYLYIYNASEGFYKATSRILETMYPGVVAYFKRQKFPVHEPQMPLVVIMFKTEEEFQRYNQMPPGVVAYYSVLTNHIVMYEQSKLVEVAPELAVKQSIATIAPEGLEQILHNIGVQQRLSRWPMWISEGLPEYFSPTSTDKRLRWKGVGMVNDMRMYELERFLKQGSTQPGEMVRQTVQAPGLSSTGYASAWALTHYLAKARKDEFHAYLTEVSKVGPLEAGNAPASRDLMAAENKKVFDKHFGASAAKLEEDLIKHLKKLPYSDPIANQTHYVVMVNTGAFKQARVTSSPAEIKKLQEEILSSSGGQRGQVKLDVRPFQNKEAANQFAKQWLGSG